ncbi:TetR/AcrR family transcriptional regulator (plasmid) [Cytobacillus spongiae]|uniref:TetR/AcrR family transcriptional regulator n=1 Tax=Cytobacillus spongiae TaxID=2901381 RepID=UPI00145CE28B|nr:TetR/AcrR family transcriptional regulator [Cytobacillus spongiae]MCA1062609.1 TetR/AcrR family transcriptional regulator [Rossellomorea aquimaris]NMH70950.1 TetR/AcrR family transcriptional regulator [Bacillus sp. RO3]UII58248.1 TetR/AcrR family transcriptional regulator [Cytobacillus spongiae]WJV28723.1 TetR/AcrR family transcriptional regulator [Rossellomorea sp. AcN35-11]
MDKRNSILESAVDLFAEYGYNQTSMQQIAESVGISKGSLYSFFQSKEDLIISIYEHYQQLVFERAFVVGLDAGLPPLERFAKQFQVQFEGILEYKSYMKMHMRGETVKNSEKLASMEHRMRGRLFSWLEHNLLDLFGSDISPYKWDLMWMTQSIYSSYMMLLISHDELLDPAILGKHVVRQITLLAEDFLDGKSTPLLDDVMMKSFSVSMDREGAFISFEKREEAWKELYNSIKGLEEDRAQYYLKIANRISEEYRQSAPDELIIKGLFRLMVEEDRLKNEANTLQSHLLPENA